jgi:dihydroorotate dehydrogenase (fumarate)
MTDAEVEAINAEASVLMKRGIEHIREIERQMIQWMEEHEFSSVAQLKGCMNQQNCEDPSVFERAQYMRAIHSFKPEQDQAS